MQTRKLKFLPDEYEATVFLKSVVTVAVLDVTLEERLPSDVTDRATQGESFLNFSRTAFNFLKVFISRATC